MLGDIIRVADIVLFGLCVGETALIVRLYLGVLRSVRRLLPYHVVLIGFSTLGLQAEAVWQNVSRIGTPASWYTVINFFLFTTTLVALRFMHMHLMRKRDLTREISPLISDPNEFP